MGRVVFGICLPRLLIQIHIFDRLGVWSKPRYKIFNDLVVYTNTFHQTPFLFLLSYFGQEGGTQEPQALIYFMEILNPNNEFDQNHRIKAILCNLWFYHVFHWSLVHLSYQKKTTCEINCKRGVVRQRSTENQICISLHFTADQWCRSKN